MNKTAARLQGFQHYRPLLKLLVIKDIKLKYRRSFLGYLWSVLTLPQVSIKLLVM